MSRISYYDQNARQYDEWFERNRCAYVSELRAVESLIPSNGTGLEIGVGTGRFASPLGIRFGVEPSRSMAGLAKERGIAVAGGLAEALPFQDERFDFALMVTVLFLLDYVEASLAESYRVLRKGGFLVVGFVDRNSSLGKFYMERKEEDGFSGGADFYSVDEVGSFLRDAGFRDLMFYQTLFHNPEGMKDNDPVKDGYGEGSFVTVRGRK